MSFALNQATVVDDAQRVRMIASAFRKTGKPIVLVPLGAGVHAGHLALVRAAKAVRGGVVIVALHTVTPQDQQLLADQGVDVIYHFRPQEPRTLVMPARHDLEPVDELALQLTQVVAHIALSGATDVIMGEKDYELLLATSAAVRDLNLAARVQGVPTVRMPDGVAVSLRNRRVPAEFQEQASALSAALTAGAHAAEAGAQQVLDVARTVLDAAGVQPEYLEVRGRDLGPAPTQGDARLLVAATVGGVRLLDNAGLPLGIGFRNLEEYQASLPERAG